MTAEVWLALIGGLGTAFALVVSGLLAIIQRLLKMLADANKTNQALVANGDKTLGLVEQFLPFVGLYQSVAWFFQRQQAGETK